MGSQWQHQPLRLMAFFVSCSWILMVYCLPPASSGAEVFRHEASRLSRAAASRVGAQPLMLAAESINSRTPRFIQPQKVLRLAVLAPSDPDHQFSLSKILPAITLAARTIERPGGALAGWRVQIVDRDSKCSSIHGPLEAFDLYNNKAIGRHHHIPFQVSFFLFFLCFVDGFCWKSFQRMGHLFLLSATFLFYSLVYFIGPTI